MNLDRFRLPDEPADRELKMNALYYKRLDILEDVRKLRSRLEDETDRRELWEQIEYLEYQAAEIARELNDMGWSVW